MRKEYTEEQMPVLRVEQAENGGWVVSCDAGQGVMPRLVGAFSSADDLAAFIVEKYGAD